MSRQGFILFLLIHNFILGQCIATHTVSNLNPVCADQFLGEYSGGIIRINLMPINSSNKHVFSTVGESEGDTYLALYDSSNNLLLTNNDDIDCGGCKQSTLIFQSVSGGGNVSGLYLILSKPGCAPLNFITNLKYSARNEYDTDPKIISTESIVQCVGSVANFTYNLPSRVVGDNLLDPWESIDATVATIDSSGKASFIKNGIARIKLKVKNSCPIINNYVVNGSLTSSINH